MDSVSVSTSPFLTIAEVAQELGTSTSTVRRLCAEGRLLAIHVGAQVRVSRASVSRDEDLRRSPRLPGLPARLSLTMEELTARWRVSALTIRRVIAVGELCVTRIGRTPRIPIETIGKYERLNVV